MSSRVILGLLLSLLGPPTVTLLLIRGLIPRLALLVLLVTFTATVFGVPLYFWLKRRHLLKLKHFLISGVVLGCVLATPISLYSNSGIFPLFSLLCATQGLIFWISSVYRNEILDKESFFLASVQRAPATKKIRIIQVAIFCGFVIFIDTLLPAKEGSFIVVPHRLQGAIIIYPVPYSGGDMASCFKTPGIEQDYKEGSILLLKKSRILGFCSLSSLPNHWIEPEFDSWRSIGN